MILDIHTHSLTPPDADRTVYSLRIDGTPLPVMQPDRPVSAGIHPWDTGGEIPAVLWQQLEEIAVTPQCVAVGECGIDLSGRGGPLFRQLQVFRRHVELSERLAKPLVIHAVKADDILLGLKRDLRPSQPWAIHGFRRKPQAAAPLLRAGFRISLGPQSNPETMRDIPLERMLAETDDSPESIAEVIAMISNVRGLDILPEIAANTARFLKTEN